MFHLSWYQWGYLVAKFLRGRRTMTPRQMSAVGRRCGYSRGHNCARASRNRSHFGERMVRGRLHQHAEPVHGRFCCWHQSAGWPSDHDRDDRPVFDNHLAPGTFIITDVEASGDQFTLTFTGATTGAVTTSTPAFGLQGVGECISCALSLGSFYSHGTYALNAGTTVITGEFIGSVGYGDVDFEATSARNFRPGR